MTHPNLGAQPVTVTVQAQRSREVTDIEHDAKGRIKRFTKTEKPD